MNKLLRSAALILALMLPTGAGFAEESGSRPGFEILYELWEAKEPGANVLLSPLSLGSALALAAEGAKGNTREEIDAVLAGLGTQTPEGIAGADCVCIDASLALREEYRAVLTDSYDADCFFMDENLTENVNRWVNERTGGMIPRIMEEMPDPDTRLLLLNAITMDESWLDPFEEEETEPDVFRTPQGEVPVEMMHKRTRLQAAENAEFSAARLCYADGGLGMWLILPREADGMGNVLEWLRLEGTEGLEGLSEGRDVELEMPVFDVNGGEDLTGPVISRGIKTAFSDQADFSGISGEPLALSGVMQKVSISVSETGTRAAAVTEIAVNALSIPSEERLRIRLDRPFILIVDDNRSGVICFTAVIENPKG